MFFWANLKFGQIKKCFAAQSSFYWSTWWIKLIEKLTKNLPVIFSFKGTFYAIEKQTAHINLCLENFFLKRWVKSEIEVGLKEG